MRWMDLHPTFYFYLVSVIISAALLLAIIPLLRDQPGEKTGFDWGWGVVILAILASGRWPSIFFPREINGDESQMLAGARALLRDPVFWRSVNGGTAGPLDFFALWPAGWIFGWQSYLPARLTAFALLAVSLFLAHQCLVHVWGRKVARVAGLAAICLEALTNAVDLLHYSTELLPITMLTVAAYAAIRRGINEQSGPLWNGLGGLMLGSVPLAKLQAIPLAAGMGLVWLVAELCSKGPNATRRSTYLLIGALLPVSLFAIQITIAGEWDNVLIPYFFSNLRYIGTSVQSFWTLLWSFRFYSIHNDSLLHLWLPGTIAWLLLMLRMRRGKDPVARVFTLASFAAFLLALICVFYPRRPFLHYWQLTIVPGNLLLGAMTGNLLASSPQSWRKPDRWLVAGCVFCLVETLLVYRAWIPNYFVASRSYYSENAHTTLVSRILPRVRPGDSVAIWGWSQYVFVETGLRQATRDPNFGGMIEAGPYCSYYRKRFLVDLAYAKPKFFLDTIGPCNLQAYDRPQFAHEQTFPALGVMIQADYILIDRIWGARLYQRRDAATD